MLLRKGWEIVRIQTLLSTASPSEVSQLLPVALQSPHELTRASGYVS